MLLKIKMEFNSSEIELGSGWCRADGWKLVGIFYQSTVAALFDSPRSRVTGTIFMLPLPNR